MTFVSSNLLLILLLLIESVSLSGSVLPRYIAPIQDHTQFCEELLKHYFDLGFSYSEIWALLAFAHGIYFSMRHIRRMLNRMGLYRRKHKSSAREVIAAFRMFAVICFFHHYHQSELTGSANCIGYRLVMYQRLRNDHHLVVDRETVRLALKVMDPDGVAERKKHRLKRRKYFSPGPNFLWHIDGYDKLKAYGFAIHGCIDGYSRRIKWLEVRSTNNDAAVIADHFLGYVCQMKADCPAGSFSTPINRTCILCPRGTYQPSRGRLSCLPCGQNLTTTSGGTVDKIQCFSRFKCILLGFFK
ncbi:uncharacterized protein [Porites lutea]|uniref:uncharacterized protein n=1 Tax=Porites lutea TaxID=51062 RepID=UPI003CC61836